MTGYTADKIRELKINAINKRNSVLQKIVPLIQEELEKGFSLKNNLTLYKKDNARIIPWLQEIQNQGIRCRLQFIPQCVYIHADITSHVSTYSVEYHRLTARIMEKQGGTWVSIPVSYPQYDIEKEKKIEKEVAELKEKIRNINSEISELSKKLAK